ncbi:MAG: hypothetical protein ABSB14_10625, partial [Candidatus Sulfotelmatobacter sp.]
MGQTTSATPDIRNGGFQLKVSARGALIRAVFGSNLMYWAVVLSGNSPLRFSIITVPALGLVAWAIVMVRVTRKLPSSDAESAHWRTV